MREAILRVLDDATRLGFKYDLLREGRRLAKVETISQEYARLKIRWADEAAKTTIELLTKRRYQLKEILEQYIARQILETRRTGFLEILRIHEARLAFDALNRPR